MMHEPIKLTERTRYIMRPKPIDRVNDVTYLWSQYDRHFGGQDRRTVRS